MSAPPPTCRVSLAKALQAELDRIGDPLPDEALRIADFCKANIAKLEIFLAGDDAGADDNDESFGQEWEKIQFPIMDKLGELKLILGNIISIPL